MSMTNASSVWSPEDGLNLARSGPGKRMRHIRSVMHPCSCQDMCMLWIWRAWASIACLVETWVSAKLPAFP